MRLRAIAGPIAEQQDGLVTHTQLHTAGSPRSTIQGASDTDRLVRMERSVYRMPGSPVTSDVRLLAKVLSAGPDAVLSHRSAAWLWGLVDAPPARPEVSVPRRRRPRTPGVVVHQSTDTHLIVHSTVRGIPVTDVGRTILDSAAVPDIDLELLVDQARRTYNISRTLLPFVVSVHARSGRRGIRALREHLSLDEMPHSDFERLVIRWMRTVGISGWTLHHRMVLPGYGTCEPDLAWPSERVVLELEGGDHRDRSTVHDNDTERQNAMSLAGWRVLRTTYRRWLRRSDQVRSEVQAALDARRSLR